MKILHLLQSSHFSGAENVVCQIVGFMREEKDIEMIYCCPEGPIRAALEDRNITFAPMKEFSKAEFKRVIREQKPDIIHAHDMRASFLAAMVCGKIPLVSHIHNNNFDSRGLSLKSVAYIAAAFKAKHIFWVSDSSFNGYFFYKLFRGKSSVLYNIIDVDEAYRKADSDSNCYDYDVAYVGRLTYPKNPQRLMRVLAKVVEKAPDVKIAVAGTGDLEEETKVLCKELGLQNNVTFLGFFENPLKLLKSAKVMVMTSRWEGTPMVALEALSLGVPIVSTPTDGLCELIESGVNGYLSDNDDELAEGIVNIVSDPSLHSDMSSVARERAAVRCNIREYKKELLAEYEKSVI